MTKGRNTAEIPGSDGELDDIELSGSGEQGRLLILKAAPRSRRTQLTAQDTKEIRCMYCHKIRPFAGAVESEERWVCEDRPPNIIQDSNCIGKRIGATDV